MIIVQHRVNEPARLADLPREFGAEIDVRYHENRLVLQHDPFEHHKQNLVTLDEFCRAWKQDGPLILNVKSEGLEQRCMEVMARYGIENWFFLDLSMPYFVRYARLAASRTGSIGPENLAVRYSEYESIHYALNFQGSAAWVWVDCFTHLPLDESVAADLVAAGFRICVVSPELQGHPEEKIREVAEQCAALPVTAVCTKHPQLWR